MSTHPKATFILEQAHKTDKHTSFLAIRLAERYTAEGRFDEAERVLSETLRAAGPNKEVHLALAETIRAFAEEDRAQDIIEHLRRSFSDGDNRYQAQFLFARFSFLYGDRSKAEDLFRSLARAKVSPELIDTASEPVREAGRVRRFVGSIGTVRPSFSFVRCVGLGCDVYISKRAASSLWGQLHRGVQLEFSVFFSFRGPVAKDVKLYVGQGDVSAACRNVAASN